MTGKIDIAFCVLLALSGLGHLIGTFKYTEFGTGLFVWSLAGVLACFLLTAMNVLRIYYPDVAPLPWIALAGNLAWMGIVALFGLSVGNLFDPRAMMHFVSAAGLAVFTVLQLMS